jgi:hypothetical protein
MEPVTVTCSATCTVTHVVSIDLPPFQLDTEGGAAIAAAVLAIWALGWGFRVLIRTLRETDGEQPPSTE